MIIDLAVGVDDTGGEGEAFLSRSMDIHRRTLVASVMPKENVADFRKAWHAQLDKIKTIFPNAKEFHAAHLLSRSGDFSKLTVKKKEASAHALQFLQEISQLVLDFDVVFVVQTVHGETYAQVLSMFNPAASSEFGPYAADAQAFYAHLSEPQQRRKLAAFFLLSSQVAMKTKEIVRRGAPPDEPILIDSEWEIDNSDEFDIIPAYVDSLIKASYRKHKATFVDSSASVLVQMADFGAYVLNRSQYIMGNREEPEGDEADLISQRQKDLDFLNATKACMPRFLNVVQANANLKDLHHKKYDEVIDDYRRKIGLDPLNFSKHTSS